MEWRLVADPVVTPHPCVGGSLRLPTVPCVASGEVGSLVNQNNLSFFLMQEPCFPCLFRLSNNSTGERAIFRYTAPMSTLAKLEHEVLQLPEDQRIALVHRVLEVSDTSPDENVEALWQDEIVRRIELLDTGMTTRIPASEVFRELDQRLA